MDEQNNLDMLPLQNALDYYIKSLNNVELIALNVAKQQLGDSFELDKCIGFIEFIKKNKIIISK